MSLHLPIGHQIEEFRIEAPLGAGRFGITYLAFDLRLERRVAVKEYMPEALIAGRDPATQRPLLHSPADSATFHAFLGHFCTGAQRIARFSHPNIVPVHCVLMHNETAYIVMDYLGEVSLARLMAAGERLGEAELLHLLDGVLSGLAVMHGAGLLHRDLKPSSIMLRADGTPVLIDIGSARPALSDGEAASARLVAGGYAPPEQHSPGGDIGPWSDIFALAATCYFAMRGEPPVSAMERALALARQEPDPLVPLTAEMTGERYSTPFLSAVSSGLELDARARPRSIHEWAATFPRPIRLRHVSPDPPHFDALDIAKGPSPLASAVSIEATSGVESPETLILDLGIPLSPAPMFVRPGVRWSEARKVGGSARAQRVRVYASLAAFALAVGGTMIVVGFGADGRGPLGSALSPRNAGPNPGDGEATVMPVAAPMTDAPAMGNAARCDALAAHPDDPGKPAGVPGVPFDAMADATTRQGIEACAAAFAEDSANVRAQFNLGRVFQRAGMLRPQEKTEAWQRAGEAYAAAARRGYAAAQGNLGQMLYSGTGGFAQNDRLAVAWLRKSAVGEFADAYMTLAHAYATGRGVEQPDQRKAYCWLTLLQRATSVRAYRAFAQQQRSSLAISAAEKQQIELRATRGADCL